MHPETLTYIRKGKAFGAVVAFVVSAAVTTAATAPMLYLASQGNPA